MKTQPLFLQMSLLKVDSAYAWCILSMLTSVLRCAQPLNKWDMHHLQIFFETTPLCHAYTNFYLSIKDLGIWDEFNLFKIFIYVHKNPFEPQAPDHLEKMAESLLYNFHREHILLKKLQRKFCSKNFTAGVYTVKTKRLEHSLLSS